VSQKTTLILQHCNFNAHQPILVIFISTLLTMFLHYLRKREYKPPKLCLFSHAVCLENDTALARCIFDIHQPIFIIFCRQSSGIMKYSVQILFFV